MHGPLHFIHTSLITSLTLDSGGEREEGDGERGGERERVREGGERGVQHNDPNSHNI